MPINIAIAIAFLAPIVIYLLYSFLISPSVNNPSDFFLASENLKDKDVFETLAATWLLLGNVTVANMILGIAFGYFNFWLIFTWAIAFVLAGLNADRIREKLGKIHTLHEFLGNRYNTSALRIGASIVTFVVSIGIISLEVVVGMSLILPFSSGDFLFPLLLGFALILVIVAYSVLGGLRAIVETDRPQVGSIIMSMIALLIISIVILSNGNGNLSSTNYSTPEWPFWVGLFFLQVPLLLGDFGTWQRIRATSKNHTIKLKSAFNKVSGLNVLLWSIMVLGGMAIGSISITGNYSGLSQGLFSVAEPVVKVLDYLISIQFPLSDVISTSLVFIFILGLVSAMLSSADSYLLIGLQTVTEDIFRIGRKNNIDEEEKELDIAQSSAVTVSRLGAIIVALIAFGFSIFIIYTGQIANALQIVFIIFGSQAVLAPLAVFALRDDIELSKYGTVALWAGVIGFITPVVFGIWTLVQVEHSFLSTWGAYLTPVGAVCIPITILFVYSWIKEDYKKAFNFFSAFIGKYK